MQDLDQAQVGQVAVHRGGGAAAVLEDGVGRELDADAARITDALARALGQLQVDAVAGIEVRPRLGDTDDGPPGRSSWGVSP